jgi:hypothetical protein
MGAALCVSGQRAATGSAGRGEKGGASLRRKAKKKSTKTEV